jgi:hypothetical protein
MANVRLVPPRPRVAQSLLIDVAFRLWWSSSVFVYKLVNPLFFPSSGTKAWLAAQPIPNQPQESDASAHTAAPTAAPTGRAHADTYFKVEVWPRIKTAGCFYGK